MNKIASHVRHIVTTGQPLRCSPKQHGLFPVHNCKYPS